MKNRIISIDNLTTNENQYADQKYKLYDAKRYGSRHFEGVELKESPIIFTYLGVDYFLVNGNVVDENGVILVNNYQSHYTKDGVTYITNADNEVFTITTSSIFQTVIGEEGINSLMEDKNSEAFHFDNMNKMRSNIVKSNIPMIANNNSQMLYDNNGKIFYLEDTATELKAKYFADDGKETDKFYSLKPLSRTINEYTITPIIAGERIALLCYRYSNDNIIIEMLVDDTKKTFAINSPQIAEQFGQYNYYAFLYKNKIFVIQGCPIKITAFRLDLNGTLENTQELFTAQEKSEKKSRIGTNGISQDLYDTLLISKAPPIYYSNENRINIGISYLQQKLQEYGNGSGYIPYYFKFFRNVYLSVGLSFRIGSDLNIQLSGIDTVQTEHFFLAQKVNPHSTTNPVVLWYQDKFSSDKFIMINQNNVMSFFVIGTATEKSNSDIVVLTEDYPNLKPNEIFTVGVWNKLKHDFYNDNPKLTEYPNPRRFNDITPYDIEIGEIILNSPVRFRTQALKCIQTSVITSYFYNLTYTYDFQKAFGGATKQFEGMIVDNFINNKNSTLNIFKRNNINEAWNFSNLYYAPVSINRKGLIFYDPNYKDTNTKFYFLDKSIGKRITQKYDINFKNVDKIFLIAQATEKYFIIYDTNRQTLYIKDVNTAIESSEYIAFQNEILDITGVESGVFIAHKYTLLYLKALGTGQGIQLSTTTYELHETDTMIGNFSTIYFSNGFLTYIYQNQPKRVPINIQQTIISAMQYDTYILLQDDTGRILLLTPEDGRLSIMSLSETIEFVLENSIIKKKDTQEIYGIKKGNPKYQMEFSNETLITLLEITSYAEIIKARLNMLEITPVLFYNKYKINCNIAIEKGNTIFIEFKDKINDDIVLGVK